MKSSTLAFVVTVCLIAAVVLPRSGPASLAERDYDLALKIAERKVQHEKHGQDRFLEQNLGSSSNSKLYRPGQTWWVLAWSERIITDFRRNNSLRHDESDPIGTLGLFHYEVLPESSHDTGPPQIRLRVTQMSIKNQPVPDPAVQSLELTLDEHLREIKKQYVFLGHSHLTPVSPEGIRSGVTPLEFYPLDAMDLSSAMPMQSPESSVKLRLPKKIQETLLALRATFRFEFSEKKGAWMEQDDFFGRPIRAFWMKNEPWPTVLHTPNGIAILLHEDQKQ